MDQPEPAVIARRLARERRRRRILVLLAALALAAATLHRPLFLGNFGVVAPGRVYRSAQPRAGLRELIRDHKIASIVNLRGGSIGDDWYVNEVRTTRETGIDFYDFPMSATHRPSRRELLTLLDLLDRCRYPLLIHCKSGSDRTGLLSALYRMSREGEPPEEAEAEFSIGYGHFEIGGPQHLHEPLDEYRAWLSQSGLAHSPTLFRSWVEREYRSDDTRTTFTPLRPGPRSQFASRPGPPSPL
jgi:hypothetical protein